MRGMAIMLATAMASAAIGGSPAWASSCTGTCGNLGPNGDVTAPPAGGPDYGYVSTNGGVDGAGQISGVDGTNGSEYITDTFSANAGDPLKFYFNYITSDGTGAFVDYAFTELLTSGDAHVAWLFTARTTPSGNTSPGFDLPTNDSTLNPPTTPINGGATNWSGLGSDSGACFQGVGQGCGSTGWIESLFNIADAGSYKIRFGVSNFGDNQFDSGLAFAGVTVNGEEVPIGGIPEPASWAMLIAGFGMVGAAIRRRRSIAVTYA